MAYTTIDDPSAYFQTLLYTGDGNDDRNLVNTGNSDLQPDWIWNKRRDSTSNHFIFDSSRGTSKIIVTDSNEAESTNTNQLQAFQTDGFQLGSDNGSNGSSRTMVAWQWKANGGTTSTDTNGAVNSTVQANTTAGFSIVTWTSAGSTNVGHGLGVAPNLIIMKARNGVENWLISSDEIGWTKRIRLNLTSGSATSSAFGQAPTSSIFYCHPATASYNYVAYCFAEKQGYSKFGSYEGSSNADGPFIYTGFKPSWIMIKNIDATEHWIIQDTARSPHNLMQAQLMPSLSDAEFTGAYNQIDSVSNGFKLRSGDSRTNASNTYIYMAFAEHPFVSSKGVPTTAR